MVLRFLDNKMSVVGLVIIALYVIMAILAPAIAPYSPYEMVPENRLEAPSGNHLFGTDHFGRDVFSRTLYGTRISLKVSLLSVTIALMGGLVLGMTAGYFGGVADMVISRLIEILFSFPDIVLALIVMAILGPSMTNLMIAIGVVYTPIFARIARGAVLEVRNALYIEASQSLGAGTLRLILVHILPNILAPVIIQTTLSLAFAMLSEAALSFLGFGVEPDMASWGIMLKDGKAWIQSGWWLTIFPGLAITLGVLSFNVMGDGLRDALDPKSGQNKA